MMFAAKLDPEKYEVQIFERNAALGRKLLVAGDGGFNLTHNEPFSSFVTRYHPSEWMIPYLTKFNNQEFRNYLKDELKIDTYVGSSERVFPVKGIKPIDVFNAFYNKLKSNQVEIQFNHLWKGWNEKGELIFSVGENERAVAYDTVVFALGGASWKVTGSDGSWLNSFQKKGIVVSDFQSSNCAFQVNWPEAFVQKSAGASIKNCAVRCDSYEKKGELVVTAFGLEGGAIYAMSPALRKQLHETGAAVIEIDLKPVFSEEQLLKKFEQRGNRSIRKLLKDRLSFTDTQVDLLFHYTTKEEFNDPYLLARSIKSVKIPIVAAAPLDEAISTVGGIELEEVTPHLELIKLPKNYCLGEMLNWDAPTGGYLLQACFSMGYYLAEAFNKA